MLLDIDLVRTGRLELPHLSILEPKSSASTNSATSALRGESRVTEKARIIPESQGLPSCKIASSHPVFVDI